MNAFDVNSVLCTDAIQVGVVYPLSPPSNLDKDCLALELMEHLLKCLTSQVTIITLHTALPHTSLDKVMSVLHVHAICLCRT